MGSRHAVACVCVQWGSEAIIKGNLYPPLHRVGQQHGKPELADRLARLPVQFRDYNERVKDTLLTEDMKTNLLHELAALKDILEQVRPAPGKRWW